MFNIYSKILYFLPHHIYFNTFIMLLMQKVNLPLWEIILKMTWNQTKNRNIIKKYDKNTNLKKLLINRPAGNTQES